MISHELRAERLSYRVGGRVVLDEVSLSAWSGELIVVTGPSGSGKSTLLSLLAGLEKPSAGRALLDGSPVGSPAVVGSSAQVGPSTPSAQVGIVLQGYGLVSALTAAENVAIVLQARRYSRSEVRARTTQALAEVGLTPQAGHLVDQLSGGQQQRVALARALVVRPDVVLADEPTAELDADTRVAVMGLLAEQAARGAIVVIASHDREVAQACDREIALDSGRLAPGARSAG